MHRLSPGAVAGTALREFARRRQKDRLPPHLTDLLPNAPKVARSPSPRQARRVSGSVLICLRWVRRCRGARRCRSTAATKSGYYRVSGDCPDSNCSGGHRPPLQQIMTLPVSAACVGFCGGRGCPGARRRGSTASKPEHCRGRRCAANSVFHPRFTRG